MCVWLVLASRLGTHTSALKHSAQQKRRGARRSDGAAPALGVGDVRSVNRATEGKQARDTGTCQEKQATHFRLFPNEVNEQFFRRRHDYLSAVYRQEKSDSPHFRLR